MSAVPVELQAAHQADADHFVALRIAAMRESLECIGRFDAQRARERFLSGFDPHCTRHIVFGGERVGFVVVKSRGDGWLLDHFYIAPSAQGQGIGTAVLTLLFAEADAAQQPLHVGALRESASNRFYVRHGFVHVHSGDYDHYYVRAPHMGS